MSLAADLVLALHFAYVAFVVGGLAAIWIGYALDWGWVRNRWFRLLHFGAIAIVAIEALIGMMCPLTVLEDALRPRAPHGAGFVQRWLQALLFWDLPQWLFTVIYLALTVFIATTYLLLPPRPRRSLHAPMRPDQAHATIRRMPGWRLRRR